MPLIPFDGQTFVAFLDISGFKHLMKDDKEAWKVLDTFYNAGYNAIINSQNKVQGLFISDCGILFSNENNSQMEKFIQLL